MKHENKHRPGMRFLKVLTLTFIMTAGSSLWADQPRPWQINFQEAVTPVMARIVDLHNHLLIIITIIAVVVLSALFFTLWKFNAKRHPEPTGCTHNTVLEIIWTTIPALIVLVLSFPSIKLLFYMDKAEHAEMTVKIVGRQWYWHYAYPDKEHSFEFDSVMVPTKELKDHQLRLLEVDHPMVVPVDTTVRLLFTADDVLHSWTVPAFGVKHDTVPGRLKEAWIRVTKEGTYYGQCSEICGSGHGYMPIKVKVVSKDEYQQWLVSARKQFAYDTEAKSLYTLSYK